MAEITPQEAIKILEINSICSPKATEFKKAVEIAKNAIQKQIPTKPYTRDLWELGTAMGYSCPTCGYDFPVSYFEACCCECGQAIAWNTRTQKEGEQVER